MAAGDGATPSGQKADSGVRERIAKATDRMPATRRVALPGTLPLLLVVIACILLLTVFWLVHAAPESLGLQPDPHHHDAFGIAISFLLLFITGMAVMQIRRHLTISQALRASESRYRSFIAQTSRIVWTTDGAGYVVEDAPGWREYTGQTFAAFRGSGWLDAVHPDDRGPISEAWQRAVRDRTLYQVEYRVRGADGVYRPFLCRAAPVLDAAGRLAEWIGVVEDISEKKAAERDRELLANIVAHAHDAIVSRDLDGLITSWNAAAERIFGYTAAEAVGQRLPQLHAGDEAGFRERNVRVNGGATVPGVEGLRWRKDGTPVNVRFSIFPVRNAGGAVIGSASIIRDVTEARRASETRAMLASIVEYANDAIISRDHAGIITTWNRAAERIFGYTAEEAIGRHVSIIHIDDMRHFATRNERIKSGLANPPVEGLRRTKDGRVLHIMYTVFPVFGPAGEVIGGAAIMRDVTELRKGARTRSLLAAIVDHATDAVISRDVEGRIMSWNAAAERLLGYTAAEAIGRPIAMIHPAEDMPLIDRDFDCIRRGAPVPPQDGERCAKDGTRIPVSIGVWPVIDEDGTIVGAAILLRDLRALKRAQADLRLAAGIYENAAEGLAITDAERRVVWVNRAYGEITGYTAAETIGREPQFVPAEGESSGLLETIWSGARTTGRWHGEVTGQRRDGTPFCMLLSLSAVPEDDGAAARYCWIFMDITERKASERALVQLNAELESRVRDRTRELEQANQELAAFSYSVSHDLRAPIRAIEGHLTLLMVQAGPQLDDAARARFERVRINAAWMGRLIDDLLRLSRISQCEVQRRQFDLSDMAARVLRRIRQTEPGRHAEIVIQPDLRAEADASLLEHALENLLGNAWKFTGRTAQARIEFGATQEEGRLVYFVKDNGAGFDMRHAHKLFSAFQRLHHRDEFEGTGIGLTIVHRIVSKHGGEVWVQAAPGDGATFFFTLG